MKKTVPVFLLLVASLLSSTGYAGVISGGTAGTEVWVEQTTTSSQYEWTEYYSWNVTAYSPITVVFTATETATGGSCTWEVDNSGSSWGMANFLLYPWDNGHKVETWYTDVVPGSIGVWGGTVDAEVNITITWGWPE
jgi:hypothetical protein